VHVTTDKQAICTDDDLSVWEDVAANLGVAVEAPGVTLVMSAARQPYAIDQEIQVGDDVYRVVNSAPHAGIVWDYRLELVSPEVSGKPVTEDSPGVTESK
jgi:hypothetical protein